MHPDVVLQGSERLVASLCSDVLMWDVGSNIFKKYKKVSEKSAMLKEMITVFSFTLFVY